jgi:hypothetical protein
MLSIMYPIILITKLQCLEYDEVTGDCLRSRVRGAELINVGKHLWYAFVANLPQASLDSDLPNLEVELGLKRAIPIDSLIVGVENYIHRRPVIFIHSAASNEDEDSAKFLISVDDTEKDYEIVEPAFNDWLIHIYLSLRTVSVTMETSDMVMFHVEATTTRKIKKKLVKLINNAKTIEV